MVHIGTGGPAAPCIYLIDSPEHPTPLGEAARDLTSTVVSVPVDDWGSKLTPWPAEPLYRGEVAYGGLANETLRWLLDELIPSTEQEAGLTPKTRAIAGYSLAGLFSLYAFLREPSLAAVACLSGSLWYEGWVEHMESLSPTAAGVTHSSRSAARSAAPRGHSSSASRTTPNAAWSCCAHGA